MKYIRENYTDTLSLSTVKNHLNVTFDEDDSLIQSYMEASLLFLEKSTNRKLRELKYQIEASEMAPISIDGLEWFILHCPKVPMYILIDDVLTDDLDEAYYYDSITSTLYVPYQDTITDIVAVLGASALPQSEIVLINQARLMLIANWYAFRESDTSLSIKEVPNGVSRIVDIISGSSI